MTNLRWDLCSSECVLVTRLALCKGRDTLKPCSRKKNKTELLRGGQRSSVLGKRNC